MPAKITPNLTLDTTPDVRTSFTAREFELETILNRWDVLGVFLTADAAATLGLPITLNAQLVDEYDDLVRPIMTLLATGIDVSGFTEALARVLDRDYGIESPASLGDQAALIHAWYHDAPAANLSVAAGR